MTTPLDYGTADSRKRKALIRKLIIGTVLLVIGVAGWYGVQIALMLHRIPEAYAAWDTGTLLVEYMKVHGDRWPKSWDDLLTVLDSEAGRQILLRGSGAAISSTRNDYGNALPSTGRLTRNSYGKRRSRPQQPAP